MDGLFVCAARFLASAALCRYSSDRDACKANTGETPRFLRFTEPCDKCGVGQLAMTRPDSALWQVPGPSSSVGGSGRLQYAFLPNLN